MFLIQFDELRPRLRGVEFYEHAKSRLLSSHCSCNTPCHLRQYPRKFLCARMEPMSHYTPAGQVGTPTQPPASNPTPQAPASPATMPLNQLILPPPTPMEQAIAAAGVGLGAYHGYRRNNSLGWGLVWGLAGGIAPVITTAVALAQGFGQPATRTNPSLKGNKAHRRLF